MVDLKLIVFIKEGYPSLTFGNCDDYSIKNVNVVVKTPQNFVLFSLAWLL